MFKIFTYVAVGIIALCLGFISIKDVNPETKTVQKEIPLTIE